MADGGEKEGQVAIGAQRANELLSYLDIEKRPNIHLLDGGLSDNMAYTRSDRRGHAIMGGLERFLKSRQRKGSSEVRSFWFIRSVLFIWLILLTKQTKQTK